MKTRLSIIGCIILMSVTIGSAFAAINLTEEEKMSLMSGQCRERVYNMLSDELTIYRDVQYGSKSRSVLQTVSADTSDLVPYLVENYHALSCRLRAVCDVIPISQGIITEGIPSARPLGCARLSTARGRWWNADRRDEIQIMNPISECSYPIETFAYRFPPSSYFNIEDCNRMSKQILEEERQMLRLLVAQDAAERGARRVIPLFHTVLTGIRNNFLMPLSAMVELFGSVIHPIPCLLTQCN